MDARDEHWMREALRCARRAYELGEVPVGAVLVRDDALLGEGWNCPISTHDPTAHAEVMAMRHAANASANYRLPDTTLYVTIEPCTMCAGAMVHARVKRVVFGALEPKAGVMSSQARLLESPWFNHAVQVEGGVLEADCRALMQDFFRQRRS
ncbi:MAG: tRNA adenosine(34) deaminase TadA [Gammaproteobacteria bacterium]|nr:MAG: tRNA adenosine(34) deaminase TadA [Gammaproteobacteria bacterium]